MWDKKTSPFPSPPFWGKSERSLVQRHRIFCPPSLPIRINPYVTTRCARYRINEWNVVAYGINDGLRDFFFQIFRSFRAIILTSSPPAPAVLISCNGCDNPNNAVGIFSIILIDRVTRISWLGNSDTRIIFNFRLRGNRMYRFYWTEIRFQI